MPVHSAAYDLVRSMLVEALGTCGTYLQDERLVELMVNADGLVWVERLGEPMECTGVIMSVAHREQVIRLLASQAGGGCVKMRPVSAPCCQSLGNGFRGGFRPWSTPRHL